MIGQLLTAGLLMSPGIEPAGHSEFLAAADAAYRDGLDARADSAKARPHFVRAGAAYEAAWDRGIRTPAVARNMAQARYLGGDLGACIRDYRLGLRIFPHDPGLRSGLAFARSQVAYPHVGELADNARPRIARSLLDRLTLSFVQLAGIAAAVAGLGWLILARAWIGARGGLAVAGGVLVLAGAAAGGWLWWEGEQQRTHWAERTAVVTTPTDLRTGNSDEYPKRLDGRLPPGVELKVLGERGGWLHVELGSGVAGWVPTGQVVTVD